MNKKFIIKSKNLGDFVVPDNYYSYEGYFSFVKYYNHECEFNKIKVDYLLFVDTDFILYNLSKVVKT